MQKLFLQSAPAGWQEGLELLTNDLNFSLEQDGLPLTAETGASTIIQFDGKTASIACHEKVHFYRAIALLLRELPKGQPFTLEESAAFETDGTMFDCSRNAVLRPETVKFLLRKMACMGLNAAMLYTEDTYEVPGYPYFGYMRGAYTAEEIQKLDDYADTLGIELIPCIQTLGHLASALKWEKMAPYADTKEVLLCDDDHVYRLIEDMITAASSHVRSRRIHIGMDEAMDLGLGKFLQKHGYESGPSIIARHFSRVMEIIRRHGLSPMIWSDMYFRQASKTADYYDLDAVIPQEVIDKVPKDASLVYWDYYHDTEEFYEDYIKRHKRFPNEIVFAGGLWTWVTFATHYGMAFRTSVPALRQCRKQQIRHVFTTMWGDNGAENVLTSALLGLQLYAEYNFADDVSLELLRERFAACTGESLDAFLDMSRLDVPNWAISEDGLPPLEKEYFSRQVLYSDPLLDLYAVSMDEAVLADHFREVAPILEKHAAESPNFSMLFQHLALLADFLAGKCDLQCGIRAAYKDKDKKELRRLAEEQIPTLVSKAESLRASWRNLWMSCNKPFGYEVLDIRLGGTAARLESAAARILGYLDGAYDKIEELEVKVLPMDNAFTWQQMASASVLF